MKCSQEQFDKIKSILEKNKFNDMRWINDFNVCPYLVNNYSGNNFISNISEYSKSSYDRTVFEEWDEDIFLEYCGIKFEPPLPKKWCIKITEKNREEVGAWFNKNRQTENNVDYNCVGCNGFYLHYPAFESYFNAIIHSFNGKEDGYEEIDIELFRKITDPNQSKNKSEEKMAKYKNTNIHVSKLLEIHNVACINWKQKITDTYLTRMTAEQQICFGSEEIDEMFKAASTDQKPVLEKIFEPIKEIDYSKLKTGSIVMLRKTERILGEGNHVDFSKHFTVVFYKTPQYISPKYEFKAKGVHNSYCTFVQNGNKYCSFNAEKGIDIDFITEVIEY